MKIHAAIVPAEGADFELTAVDLDEPRDDELLVRIHAVGICHTDVAAQHGVFGLPFPALFGHEGAGVVERTGAAVRGFAAGDRVAVSFRSCGECPTCAGGLPSYCDLMGQLNYAGARPDGSHMIHRDGQPVSAAFFGQSSFATHVLTSTRNCVKLPDGVPFAVAAPLGCSAQTGAGSIFNALACRPGSSLLITGAGAVGLCAVMAAKLAGCHPVIVAEPLAARRDLALQLGATHAVDPATGELSAAVRRIAPAGVDHALDTSGRPDILDQAMAALAIRGVLALVGIPPDEAALPGRMMNFIASGQMVRGVIEGDADPATFLPLLMQYYLDGRFPLDRFVSLYDAAQINEAIADQKAGRCVKPVLLMADVSS